MDEQLRIFVDDHGISRSLKEIWLPHIGADLIWISEDTVSDEIDLATLNIPMLELSPANIAALSSEETDAPGHIVAIFGSLESLQEAAAIGLQGRPVVIRSYAPEDGQRVAPGVHFRPGDQSLISRMRAKGFTFVIQPLPNVTARPWPAP